TPSRPRMRSRARRRGKIKLEKPYVSGRWSVAGGQPGHCLTTDHPAPSSTIQKKHDHDRQDHVSQSDRQQELPSEVHQLVEPKSRQRPAYPDVEEQEPANLADECEVADQG